MFLAAIRLQIPAALGLPPVPPTSMLKLLIRHRDCTGAGMFQPSASISDNSTSYSNESSAQQSARLFDNLDVSREIVPEGIRRRWRRERRRRRVGRAYDMALEIAHLIPTDSRVLDVGCGSGFIAHHLASLIGTN